MKLAPLTLLFLISTWLALATPVAQARHAAILVDADSGNVLYDLEANQAWYPASLTKLMTLYMTFSALESGSLRLNQVMYASSHAAKQPTSKLGLHTFDEITVEDAILAIITRSANDAAVVLAEEIGGSEKNFAIKMTRTAHDIGMYGSHFMNATGLPHDWQTTTARDMAVLAMRILRDFPQYYAYFQADGMYFNGRDYRAINKFVAQYPGAEGMKTGYTCGSGYNLVSTARQYGKRLIGVILGGHTSSDRYDMMFNLMDMGFSNPYQSSYRSKNLMEMNKDAVGTPPYQLSCGHRPRSFYAGLHHHNSNHDEEDTAVRYVKKPSHRPLLAHHGKHTPAEPVTKIHIAGKEKSIIKEGREKHANAALARKDRHRAEADNPAKTSRLDRAHNKHGKPVVEAKSSKAERTKKSQAADKRELASAKSKGKGYYSPDREKEKDSKSKSKTSTKSAAASTAKGKKVQRKDENLKTAAKPGTKSKKTAKGKS